MKETGGKARGAWRTLTGVLLAGATLLCGMAGTAIAHADDGIGDYVRIELATKDGNGYRGDGLYITSPTTENTPVTFSGAADDTTLWSTAWGNNDNYNKDVYGEQQPRTVSLSNKGTGLRIKGGNVANNSEWTAIDQANNGKLCVKDRSNGYGGWESIRIEAGGDGTVVLRDAKTGEYFAAGGSNIVATGEPEDIDENNGHFIIHTDKVPAAPTQVKVSDVAQTTATVSFTGVKDTILSGYEVTATPNSGQTITVGTTGTKAKLEGLAPGTTYNVTVKTVNGPSPASTPTAPVQMTTFRGAVLAPPSNVTAQEDGAGVKISWSKVDGAKGYEVWRGPSRYAADSKFVKVSGDEPLTGTDYTDANPGKDGKYSSYYKVRSVNGDNEPSSLPGDTVSLDQTLFGDHTLVFAPTDDMAVVDQVLAKLYADHNTKDQYDDAGNLVKAGAQFNSDKWQVYFKPGSYIEQGNMISTIQVGFYTAINGLGKQPTDVKLNNIEIPAYLDNNNATCDFWRSIENLSVKNTGAENGKSTDTWAPDDMNWAVAQAAPMRRVQSDRVVNYDWYYGAASGGYTADSKFDGINSGGNSGGTWGGQQFYTRNSEFKGAAFGTTLNNFLQGVTGATNIPAADGTTGSKLIGADGITGTTNWGFPSADKGQQTVTAIDTTEKIAEKPFLYMDDNGTYQVFVPGWRENAKGVSWGDGKDNDGMGVGKSLPLSDFYVAKPTDTAKQINEKIDEGKNIYLTPGEYHAEEPINIDHDGTIVLGTGMATIIPDNEDAAVRIADGVTGVHLAGVILDAGSYSKYLLQVGTKKSDEQTDAKAKADPILLQDIFFRIGGTTSKLTKADIGIEINTGYTVTDHFWIWRADHGAGVKWGDAGNYSRNGIIVNGDNVTAYALFDEHFEEYDVLWNGEYGKTYFLQNEKCYDPIAQDKWMSHNGTVNGYSAYKVANHVKHHYAVGLGSYNVFIYTGPEYDSSKVSIQLDNPIEVPNSPDVIIENATTQTMAKSRQDGSVEQRFNHIINGVGAPVYAGTDATKNSGNDGWRDGSQWSRKFLLSYRDGTAVYGKDPYPGGKILTEDQLPKEADGTVSDKYKEDKDGQKVVVNLNGKFVGIQTDENVRQLGDDIQDFDKLPQLKEQVAAAEAKTKSDGYGNYPEAARKALEDALKNGQTLVSTIDGYSKDYLKYEAKYTDGKDIVPYTEAIKNALLAFDNADYTALNAAIDAASAKKESDYTAASWKPFAKALADAKAIQPGLTSKDQGTIDAATKALTDATAALVKAGKPVSKVTVTVDKESLTVGDTAKATVKVEPADADGADKVSWQSSDEKVATVSADGTITALAAGTTQIHAVVGTVQSNKVKVTVTKKVPECKPLRFLDVTSGTPHREDIDWLSCSGITTGFHDEANDTYTFKPMNTVVRQDMAAFLYRLAGEPPYTPTAADKAKFTDVDESTPHAREIWWLAHEGISTGWDNGDGTYSFRPMNTVVRQDMAAFLHKLAVKQGKDASGRGGVTFTDVNDKTPHADDIRWLARTGVTIGWANPDGKTAEFRGMNEVVRQDMAAFLHKMDTNVLHPAE